MDSQLIPAHLKRVQEESKISLTVIQKSPHDSHPDDIAGHLFALTLMDDGPETTLGKDTKDPTTHWNSERIGCED